MNIYFTADLHLGHNKILLYEKNRLDKYKDISIHDHKIIKTLNHYCNEGDILYILGDIGWKHSLFSLKNIKATKVLIKGNHDKESNKKYYEAGFAVILDQAIINLNKNIRVKLSHFPYDDLPHKNFDNMPMEEDMWLLHGHIHNKYKINLTRRTINVGWDKWHRPINGNFIVNLLTKVYML